MSSTQVVQGDLDRGLAELEALLLTRPPNILLAEYFSALAAEDVLEAEAAAQVATTLNSVRYSVVPVDDAQVSDATAALARVAAELTAMSPEERQQIADRVRQRIQQAIAEQPQNREGEHTLDSLRAPAPLAPHNQAARNDRDDRSKVTSDDGLLEFDDQPDLFLPALPATESRRAGLPRVPMELAALAVLLTFFGGYFFRDAANKVAGASESSPPFIVPIAGRTAPGPWVDAIRSLGNAEARATHYGKARLALELALPYSEEDPTELNNLAWYYLLPDKQAGTNPQRALQLINQALGVRRAWEFLDTAAEAHFQLGDFKEAIRLETEAINAPNERRSANDSAFLERQMEKFQNAEQTHIHVPVAPVQK
ncbi:MAG TPA: hypothetical protein VGP63_02580 [Planctomycetaceae bacterium]|jgi:tetratricopeptide (TPR) repeat protein|nr:hypothetical protein [Planctomycetaceae bacterium]